MSAPKCIIDVRVTSRPWALVAALLVHRRCHEVPKPQGITKSLAQCEINGDFVAASKVIANLESTQSNLGDFLQLHPNLFHDLAAKHHFLSGLIQDKHRTVKLFFLFHCNQVADLKAF
jgi:hypothetical protein